MSSEKESRELYRCGDLRIVICGSDFALWRGDRLIQNGKDWRPISAVFFSTIEMRAQRRLAEEARKAAEREEAEGNAGDLRAEDGL